MDTFKLTPKNLGAILGLNFVTSADTVTGLIVGYEVNYGEMSLPFQLDIWAKLTATQKAHVQQLYDKLKANAASMIAASV